MQTCSEKRKLGDAAIRAVVDISPSCKEMEGIGAVAASALYLLLLDVAHLSASCHRLKRIF